MLKSPLLFAVSVLVTLLSWASTAQATEKAVGLNFDLPPTAAVSAASVPVDIALKSPSSDTLTSPKEDYPIEALARPAQTLPSLAEIPEDASVGDVSEEPVSLPEPAAAPSDIGVQFRKDSIELPSPAIEERTANLTDGFGLLQQPIVETESSAEPEITELNYDAIVLDDWIFEGGSRSLVAHTVGSAEGTRHWDGRRTKAYYGHEDPGNGAWNLGTFSYQHEAVSPEDADEKQLRRLKYQGIQLEKLADKEGVQLSLFEKLNGLDLANQAPIAALGKGGYIERLAQARRLSLDSEEAIVWARTRAYLDPETRSWNAPGLGNNLLSISRDQERRMSAISKALQAYGQVGSTTLALNNLEAISLEESELTAPQFDGELKIDGELKKGTDNIGIRFELSENDIRQSMSDAEKTMGGTTLGSAMPADKAIANNVLDGDVLDGDVLGNEILEETLSAEALEVEATGIETIDEQLLPTTAEMASYIAGLDSSSVVAFPLPSEDASEPADITEVDSTEISSTEADSTEANSTDTERADAEQSADTLVADNIPLATAAQTHEEPAAVVSVGDEPESVSVDETELAIPAPLRTEADRGDRPAPNRAWWRSEDKVVRKK